MFCRISHGRTLAWEGLGPNWEFSYGFQPRIPFSCRDQRRKKGILVTTSLTLPELPAGASQTLGLLWIVPAPGQARTELWDKSQSQNHSRQIPAGA